MLQIYVVLTFVATCLCDESLLSVLKAQSGIGTFIQQLEAIPDLLDYVSNSTNGPFTVLAPTDSAWQEWAAANPSMANSTDDTTALMRYHFLQQSLVSQDFTETSFFAHSLLNDTRYANVTGGQVVELSSINGSACAISGLRAVSTIATADIPFQGGWIQITNSVLSIPSQIATTITRLKLNSLLALLNKGGFTDPNTPSFQLVTNAADLSVFPPNDPRFGASYTGFDGLSQEEIRRVLNYSTIQYSPPLYSSKWKNDTKIPTLAAPLDATFTQVGNDFYIDAAKLLKTDYLIANGVLQIIDNILNPNTTGIGPAIVPGSGSSGNGNDTSSGSGGLSPAAAAGVGIAVGAVLLGLLIGGALYVRQRKRRNLPICGNRKGRSSRRYRPGQQRLPEQDTPGIPRAVPRTIGGGHDRVFGTNSSHISNTTGSGNHASMYYNQTTTQSDMELSDAPPPHYGTHELDNKTFPSPPGTAHGGPNGNNNGNWRRHSRQNVSVVEIYSPDGTVTTHTTSRSPVGGHHHHGYYGPPPPPPGSNSHLSHSTASGGGGRNSRLDEPLPAAPKPSTPQEIDGRSVREMSAAGVRRSGSGGSEGSNRTRIEVRIHGEQPRHLGFQAMY